MYNKTCEYCGEKFKSPCKTRRFCCISCTSMYRKKRTIKRNEAIAAKIGITVEELRLKVMRDKYARVSNERKKPIEKAPKSYAEIKAANRKNPIVDGWRGAPVLGGGKANRNDSSLRISELPRIGDAFFPCSHEND